MIEVELVAGPGCGTIQGFRDYGRTGARLLLPAVVVYEPTGTEYTPCEPLHGRTVALLSSDRRRVLYAPRGMELPMMRAP